MTFHALRPILKSETFLNGVYSARPVVFTSTFFKGDDAKYYEANPEVSLEYKIGPAKQQRRFDGRVALEPKLNLTEYRFRAVVDFVTIKAFSARHVRRSDVSNSLKRQTGVSCSVESGRHGKVFIKVQEPQPQQLINLLTAINDYPSLSTIGDLNEIEVSVDIYPKQQRNHDIPSKPQRLTLSEYEKMNWAMTEHINRHFLPPTQFWDYDGGQPRSVYSKADRHWLFNRPKPTTTVTHVWSLQHSSMIQGSRDIYFPENLPFLEEMEPGNFRPPMVNGTSYFGEKGADVMFRIMYKLKDRQNRAENKFELLSINDRRARIEVTLKGKALKENNLENCLNIGGGLRTLRRKFFKFWIPTLPLTADTCVSLVDLERFQRGGVLAVRQVAIAERERQKYLNRRVPGRCGSKKWRRLATDEHEGLQAYSQLNKRCADALSRIEKSWSDAFR